MIKNPFKDARKKILNHLKITVPLIVILAGLLTLLVLQISYPSVLNYSKLQRDLKNQFENYNLIPKSTADVFTYSNRLTFKFKINKKDNPGFNQFADNLGLDPKVFDNLSVELDKQSLEKLSPMLPVTLTIYVEPKKLSFRDKSTVELKNSLSVSDYNLATGSSKLNLRSNGIQDFSLDISDPQPLLIYATQSGQLRLAKKSYGLFPILQKIARMELRVNGTRVSGEILLK